MTIQSAQEPSAPRMELAQFADKRLATCGDTSREANTLTQQCNPPPAPAPDTQTQHVHVSMEPNTAKFQRHMVVFLAARTSGVGGVTLGTQVSTRRTLPTGCSLNTRGASPCTTLAPRPASDSHRLLSWARAGAAPRVPVAVVDAAASSLLSITTVAVVGRMDAGGAG